MKYLKHLLVAVFLFSVFMAAYGATANAFPSGGILGRGQFQGYFSGTYSSVNLDNVFPIWYNNSGYGYGSGEAMPGHIDTAQEFIDFVYSYLLSGNAQLRTGAAFMIYSMLNIFSWWNSGRDQAIWYFEEWANTIKTAQAQGSIAWRSWRNTTINSAYQRNIDDVAWFDQNRSSWTMSFGWGAYLIRWECANPVHTTVPGNIPDPWSATGTISVTDGVSDSGDTARNISTRPGDTLTFQHGITNHGPNSANIWFHREGRNGAQTPWTAQYYNNTTLSGSPVVTRSEYSVDNTNGTASPAPGVNADNYSVRWTKTQSFTAGDYIFTMKVDDGGRLYVDGVLVLNSWGPQGVTSYTTTRNLSAGNHTLVFEYNEQTGSAWATLDFTNYYPQGGTDSGWYSAGQTKPNVATEVVNVPGDAAPGTQYCRRMLWDWKNSWGGGDNGAGTSGRTDLACATVVANYTLQPTINVTVNGAASPGSIAEVGDTLAFEYDVNNTGGASGSVACTIYGSSIAGYASEATPARSTSDPGFSQPAHGCPRSFPAGNTDLVTETIPAVTAGDLNRTICRSLYVNPASFGGSALGTEVCVRIVGKPYVRVHGGDISAGNGLATAEDNCATSNPSAAVVSWNRGIGQGYAGAGAQYAVMALSQIQDVSSALGNAGGAQKPEGLAFANTTASIGNGDFGGDFGSTACILNHYATRPGTVSNIPANVDAMTNGSYGNVSGNVTLGGGTVDSPDRISVFVNGDVYITSDITYGGSWTVASMPFFRLIAQGNIYIDNGVSQLDGLYVAQANGASGGTIYTCTTSAAAMDPGIASFYNDCDQKLIVNGALVGNQVQLGRTSGTLSRATAGETASGGFAGEAINYGPIMWIPQFSSGLNAEEYDAITSLPPIL